MKETLLKKEFKERDVQRLRNLITKKYGDSTANQVGYEKIEQERLEGDVWEENGKTWMIKNGIKQTVTKLDSIKEALRMPYLCPSCSTPMGSSLDKKFYPIHKTCFDCVVKKESKLKAEGKYEEYAQNIIRKNIITYIEEAEKFIEELEIANTKETYVTEQGDVEDWEGGLDNKTVVKTWKEELQDLKTKLEK